MESIKTAIEQCSNPQTKKELQERYDKMRRIVEHAEGIPALFAKNMTRKDGKYIVFCKDKQHMDELIEASKEWFADIDTHPEIYSVYSGEGYSEKTNKNTIKSFEASKSKHLKLLFSVDMLNEGLHVEDISGVIMLRPTDSRIIYLQQLGRALSSDTSREKILSARKRGGRIIAVGTTSCRTLESAFSENGEITKPSGDTNIFIYPGYKFKVVDALITNFHLPESTLIMLVSALAGRENIMKAYNEAISEKYRFFSFGDAMFIY